MTLVATYEVTSPVEYFDLVLPAETSLPRRYRLVIENLASDRAVSPAPDALTTMYAGFGRSPVVWHEGPSFSHYNNTGDSNFAGESNSAWYPVTPLLLPQRLALGSRVSIDTGTRLSLGTVGEITVFCAGTVSGNPVKPMYQMTGVRGAMGGNANMIFPRTGSPFFPHDGAQGFDWYVPFSYGGGVHAVDGRIPTGFRFRNCGGGKVDGNDDLIMFNFVSGRVELYAEGEGEEWQPPAPPPSYTVIGNLSGGAWAFDGNTSKTSGGGSCSWKAPATSTWVGKAWASPWQPSQIRVYASSDAGFVFNTNPQVTVSAYWSDTLPAHETDGTLIGSQTITDANSAMVAFTPPGAPHAYHWIVVSHAGTATSMYVAQAVIG